MRSYPTSKWEKEDAKRLIVDQWILNLLKMNPSYPYWGPGEDYMITKGDGWNKAVIYNTWKEFDFGLDDLNEVVNFYFSAERDSVKCSMCGGCGEHPDAQWVTESFYRHSSPFCQTTQGEIEARKIMEYFGSDCNTSVVTKGFPSEEILNKYPKEFREFCESMAYGDGFWNDKITQDELDALIKDKRFLASDGEITLDMINNCNSNDPNRKKGLCLNHDAINRGILCKTRCERLGLPYYCPKCDGHGNEFTEDKAHASLTLWVLHPRKGASRGVEIKRIEEEDLKSIFAYLKKAAKRNAQRFSKVGKIYGKEKKIIAG